MGLGSCETRIPLKAFLSTSRHVTQISFSAIVDLKYIILQFRYQDQRQYQYQLIQLHEIDTNY